MDFVGVVIVSLLDDSGVRVQHTASLFDATDAARVFTHVASSSVFSDSERERWSRKCAEVDIDASAGDVQPACGAAAAALALCSDFATVLKDVEKRNSTCLTLVKLFMSEELVHVLRDARREDQHTDGLLSSLDLLNVSVVGTRIVPGETRVVYQMFAVNTATGVVPHHTDRLLIAAELRNKAPPCTVASHEVRGLPHAAFLLPLGPAEELAIAPDF